MERPLDAYAENEYNEDKSDDEKHDENEYGEDEIDKNLYKYDMEEVEANSNKDNFDEYVDGHGKYDGDEADHDEKDRDIHEASVPSPSPLDLSKIGKDLFKMHRRAPSSLGLCVLVSVWVVLLLAVFGPVSAAPTHLNHRRPGNIYHARFEPSPIVNIATLCHVRPDSTPSLIATSYGQQTAGPSPGFMEYTATAKTDQNLAPNRPTKSLQPLHAKGSSLDARDNSGLSTGAMAGVVIAVIVVAILTFGIGIWKCVPRMEHIMG